MGYRTQAVSGIKWNTLVKVGDTIIQIAKIAIIARFLQKSDFGLLAIINTVLGFTAFFTDLGLTVAMLHKQDISREQYSSIYRFNWMLNGLVFLVVCAIAPFIADFYNDPRLTHLIILLGLTILIGPIGKIFQTIKTKNLEFAFISKLQMVISILGLVLTILFLLLNMGIYSIIFSSLLTAFFAGLVYSIAGRKQFRLMFYYKYSIIKDYMRIGLYEVGTQIMDYIAYKIDIILIGKLFGMDNLGIYNLGKELVLKPMKMINPIITSVATPIFAKIQNEAEALKSNYVLILRTLSFINFPLLALLLVLAQPAVTLVYGEKFTEVVYFVQVLSIWGIFATIGNPAGVLTIAKGRTDLGFKWTLIRVASAPLAIYIASFFSIEAVAWSQVVLQLIFYTIYWRILIYPLSKIRLDEYFLATFTALITAGISGFITYGVMRLFELNTIIHLIAGSILFGTVYLGLNYLFNKHIVDLIKSLLLKKEII